jgi:glycosyltransferase involved in cell wall biosynthesis
MIKLSIITINYNNASGLQKTMESVFAQTSKEFEYIIIDGASTDHSVQVIQQFNQSTIQSFRWISDHDSGIYNAMNKGIRMAQGEYINFLNSGDWLVDEKVVEDMINELPDCDIFVGNVIQVRQDGKKRYCRNDKRVSLLTFYRGTIQHTSAYIRRSLFDKYGLYDESLKIVSDWKWYLQVAGLHKADVQFTERYVTNFDMTGISSTQLRLDKAERRKVLEELIPEPILIDYDRHYFDIDQMERLKKHLVVYKIAWFLERLLFKAEKQKNKRAWK